MASKGDSQWSNGVRIDKEGNILGYNYNTGSSDYYIDNTDDVFLIGYFYRPNQLQGVSPLSAGLELFKQTNDAVKYALQKARLAQAAWIVNNRNPMVTSVENTDVQTTEVIKTRFGNSVVHFDLGIGEDAKMIGENTPSNEFQSFIKIVMEQALATLDIPYSFYDSSYSNYYGTKGAFDSFIDSISAKQRPYYKLLNNVTKKLQPENHKQIQWRGVVLPRWRMYEDAKSIGNAIVSGMVSPQEAAKQYGFDVYDNLAELEKYSKAIPSDMPMVFKRDKIRVMAENETADNAIESVNVNY